jgi:hypothetical protein
MSGVRVAEGLTIPGAQQKIACVLESAATGAGHRLHAQAARSYKLTGDEGRQRKIGGSKIDGVKLPGHLLQALKRHAYRLRPRNRGFVRARAPAIGRPRTKMGRERTLRCLGECPHNRVNLN